MRKVLITGGAGFIGSEIVNKLCDRVDWNVTVIDNMSEQIHGKDWEKSYLFNKIKGKCSFINASMTDLNAVSNAIDDKDYVIHLAAETGTGQSMYQINRYNEINIMGTSNLLQAISMQDQSKRIKKIILSSSRSVYGEGKYECKNCGVVYPRSREKEKMQKGEFACSCPQCGGKIVVLPTSEDSAIMPASLYAYTKYSQEMMLITMCPALNVDYTIFRFQNVYGVGQSLNNPYTGILSVFSGLLMKNKTVNVFEDGLESRDYVNVSDIADGVISALECEKSNGQVINLGSGIDVSIIELAYVLKDHFNSNSEIRISGDYRVGDIAHNKADISKAKEILGFYPKIGLDDGIESFCKWVMCQKERGDNYEQSLWEMERAGMFFRKGN